MRDTDYTYDRDVFGNRPSDGQGNLDGRDVLGIDPKDIWGNPQTVRRNESSIVPDDSGGGLLDVRPDRS